LAHRARSYYYVNNHTFGGKRFATEFSRKHLQDLSTGTRCW
jgi:hypothetical protein